MQPQQVTVENLRRVFKVCNSDKVLKYNSLLRSFLNFTQVDPSEAWLQDECDGTAYFPQEGGQFNLHSLGLAPYATLIVEGPEITASMPSPRTSNLPPPRPLTVSSTNHSSMPSLPPPSFRSVTAPKRVASFSLKVVKATMCRQGKRKAEFQPISQTYLELVESTANLEHILGIIQKRWGTEYTLVTSDGLPLEDSPATQGLLLPKQMFCVL